MGPQVGTCGERRSITFLKPGQGCFNGAAGWYLRREEGQRRFPFSRNRFNGAAGWYLRRATNSPRSSLLLTGFNGAAGWYLRRGQLSETLGEGGGASMGPQVGTCGEPLFAPAARKQDQGFNGAAGWYLRREMAGASDELLEQELQWGRRLVPAESQLCR